MRQAVGPEAVVDVDRRQGHRRLRSRVVRLWAGVNVDVREQRGRASVLADAAGEQPDVGPGAARAGPGRPPILVESA